MAEGAPRVSCVAVILPSKDGAEPFRLVADSVEEFIPQLYKKLMEVRQGFATVVIDGRLARLSNPIQTFEIQATVGDKPHKFYLGVNANPVFDDSGRFSVLS